MRSHLTDQASLQPLRIDLAGNGSGPDWVEIELRHSRRARRPGLRVRPGMRPEIVLPAGAAPETANRLLAHHKGWLRRKLGWTRSVEDEARRLGLLTPGVFWLGGQAHAAPTLARASTRAGPKVLEGWYRDRARTALTAATEQTAADLATAGLVDRGPGRITIRDPRSRWGSCSSRGNLSYSWRLVMMPREVLGYVVCHEVCHLRVHDHSQRFWRLMDMARPGWREEAAWLRRYGPLISLHQPRGAGADTGPPPLPPDLPPVQATTDAGTTAPQSEPVQVDHLRGGQVEPLPPI